MKQLLLIIILFFFNIAALHGQDNLKTPEQIAEYNKRALAMLEVMRGPFTAIGLPNVDFTMSIGCPRLCMTDSYESEEISPDDFYFNNSLNEYGKEVTTKHLITDLTQCSNAGYLSHFCNSIANLDNARLETAIQKFFSVNDPQIISKLKSRIRLWKDNPEQQKNDCLVYDENNKPCFLSIHWVSMNNVRLLSKDILPQTDQFNRFIASEKMAALTKELLTAFKSDKVNETHVVSSGKSVQFDSENNEKIDFPVPYIPGTLMVFKEYNFHLLDDTNADNYYFIDKNGKSFVIFLAPYYFDGVVFPHNIVKEKILKSVE